MNQNRSIRPSTLSRFADRLRWFIAHGSAPRITEHQDNEDPFNALALELFTLQFTQNEAYRRFCETGGASPTTVSHWTSIPAVPSVAFKELELTSLPVTERTAVFYSSGTTGRPRSRHFHCAASLALYEDSLLTWFQRCRLQSANAGAPEVLARSAIDFLVLTPPGSGAPHSSLVHMFETLCRVLGSTASAFCGTVEADGTWSLDLARIETMMRWSVDRGRPLFVLGTAFNYVHLLERFSEAAFTLPPGSFILETGGYKGRSRRLPKAELHALLTECLGVPPRHIICEYGMSELSSQAYDIQSDSPPASRLAPPAFCFPPWARVRIVSPETGREVADGDTGLIRIFDLANVWSVLAIQTEDLGIRRGDGFELLGRAAAAEPRGCSLMTVDP